MSRFASIKAERAAPPAQAPSPLQATVTGRSVARAGKRAVSGYFSADLRRALHQLGLEQDLTLQALMGEAFDDLMRKYGKHPFGER